MHTHSRRPRRTPRRTARRTWRRLRYRRIPYWTAISLIGLLAFGSWNTTVRSAQEARDSWGATVRVPVATARIEPGERVTDSAITWRDVPSDLFAGEPSADPSARTATGVILADEVIAEERLAPAGAAGASALMPAGTRGIAVPLDDTVPPLDVGDRVELLVGPDALGPATTESAASGLPRTSGTVVDLREDTVTVAVPASAAAAAASAVAYGAVTLALLP